MQSVIGNLDTVAVLSDAQRVKAAMRERIRAERRNRGAAHREAAARSLAEVALEVPEIFMAECVAAYASTPSAPGTIPLRRALRGIGIRVLLPVLLGNGHLDWCVDTGSAGPQLIDTSSTSDLLGMEAIREAQVVIIPALAVDTLGNRLGQGAGFYDRTLRMIDALVPVFAVVYDGEVLDAAVESVPEEPHDRPVDAIITPHRCLRLPRRRR